MKRRKLKIVSKFLTDGVLVVRVACVALVVVTRRGVV